LHHYRARSFSPVSVAQYLDAVHPLFDVVVFDEASQIPVSSTQRTGDLGLASFWISA
jgi:hypothetical protein